MAERWEIGENGLVWTFHLKKGIHFHDGTELTSEDVRFTYEMISKVKNQGYRFFFNYVQSVEAPDPYTVRIHLSHFDQALWGGLLGVNIVPKHLLAQGPLEEAPFNKKPIGSGPFRFVSQNSEEIVLESNPDYFLGKPFLNHIKVKVFPSQRSNLTHLVSGQVDFLFLLDTEDYNFLPQLPEIKIYHNWNRYLNLLFVNSRREIFKSPKVRKALSLAIDRDQLRSSSSDEKWEPSGGPIYQESHSQPPARNLEEAARLFREEGWVYSRSENLLTKDGKPFQFSILLVEGEELYEKAINKIQAQLLELGIKVETETIPAGQFFDRLFKRKDFDMALYRYVEHPYYFSYYNFWHSSQIGEGLNFSFYSNSEADRALDEIRLGQDETKVQEAKITLQKTLLEDPPALFLFWRRLPIAVHKRFQGIPEDYMENFKEFRKVWVKSSEQKYK